MIVFASSLTVNHESARIVYWNYVKALLMIRRVKLVLILITPQEYDILIKNNRSFHQDSRVKFVVKNSRGRFCDRITEFIEFRLKYLSVGLQDSIFLSSFSLPLFSIASTNIIINQNPLVYRRPVISQKIIYFACCLLTRLSDWIFSSSNSQYILFSVSKYIENEAKTFLPLYDHKFVVHSGHSVPTNFAKDDSSINLNKYKHQNCIIRFISVSSYASHKNIEETLHILSMLSAEGINVNLTLVGSWPDNEYEKKILNLISVGLPFEVHVAGRVEENIKLELLRKSDVYISTSKMESFGLPILEAHASGLICIVKGGTGMDEIVMSTDLTYEMDIDVLYFIKNKIESGVFSCIDNNRRERDLRINLAKLRCWNLVVSRISNIVDKYVERV